MKEQARADLHALEARANQGQSPASPNEKVVPWWDGPKPSGVAMGVIKQVDCLGKRFRLVVQDDDHKTVKLLVTDPAQVADHWWQRKLKLELRSAKHAPGEGGILSQGERQAGDQGRSGHHRVPVKPSPYRWVVLSIFVLCSAINYLDRQTLATLAPLVRAEFHLSNAQYGLILTVFSIAYAACAPFAGMLIDRIGLNRRDRLAVGVWSCAGICTGFTRGLGGLLGCRGVLGMSEAAGIPGAGKAIHRYLLPAERALGNAWNQAGVSLGLILAPPVATWIAMRYGWRQAFVITGGLGLIWIPLWILTARLAEPPHGGGGDRSQFAAPRICYGRRACGAWWGRMRST